MFLYCVHIINHFIYCILLFWLVFGLWCTFRIRNWIALFHFYHLYCIKIMMNCIMFIRFMARLWPDSFNSVPPAVTEGSINDDRSSSAAQIITAERTMTYQIISWLKTCVICSWLHTWKWALHPEGRETWSHCWLSSDCLLSRVKDRLQTCS